MWMHSKSVFCVWVICVVTWERKKCCTPADSTSQVNLSFPSEDQRKRKTQVDLIGPQPDFFFSSNVTRLFSVVYIGKKHTGVICV
jgi:hypothetical protein